MPISVVDSFDVCTSFAFWSADFRCFFCERVPSGFQRADATFPTEAEEELLPAARIQSSGLETIDDFRLTRSRLTFRRSQEVQRRRPRHLPYDEAAKWARAMNRWETAEEWREWLESGEKRNAYIPNDPPKYYGDDWRGWDHFLLGADDDPDGDAGPDS